MATDISPREQLRDVLAVHRDGSLEHGDEPVVDTHIARFTAMDLPIEVERLDAEDGTTLILSAAVVGKKWVDTRFHVRYDPELGHIDVSGLQVDVAERGHGIAARLGLHALYTARDLDYRTMSIESGPTMGRAIWARYGFRFHRVRCLEDVRSWFERSLPLLGVDDVDLSDCATPDDFFVIGAEAPLDISLGEVATRVGYVDPDLTDIISANSGIEDLHAGHALMLLGPNWYGVLPAIGPLSMRFEGRCRRRLKALGIQVPDEFRR